MAEITKPYNVNLVWAADSSAVSVPGSTGGFDDARIKNGWGVEIPPLQDFNFIDKRQDQFNAYLNQHGIPEWDGVTEFQANKSYIQVAGNVYKCLKTNTNIYPLNDSTQTWIKAFPSTSDLDTALKIRPKLYYISQI